MAAESKPALDRTVGALRLTTPSDREVAMTRSFNAPRQMVFDAYTKPELMKQWLQGPPGWTMPVCEIDLRVGGKYRYAWKGPKGEHMALGGVFREIVSPELLVVTEKFDEEWYPGEAIVSTKLTEQAGGTLLTLTILYVSREARDIALKTPMDSGVAASYDRLAELLASGK